MVTFTINDQLILDESSGLQDDDVVLASLSADFQTFLSGKTIVAIAQKDAMLTVTPTGSETLTGLVFSNSTGGSIDGMQAKEADGSAIKAYDSLGVLSDLYFHTTADPDLVIVTTSATTGGDLVAAFYLDDSASLTSPTIEMATFRALYNDDATLADADYLDWGNDLAVTAQSTLSFDFDTLKSGKFLWVAVGDQNNALLVTGKNVKVDANGDPLTGNQAGDLVNTSQGGQGATIGIDNQMMTPGDTAMLTFVTGFTAVTPPDQTGQNINEIDYGGYINTGAASMFISQIQGSGTLTLDMAIWEAGGGTTPEEKNNYDEGLLSDTAVPIASVSIGGQTWSLAELTTGPGDPAVTKAGITVSLVSGTTNRIHIEGAEALDTVEITAAAGETYNRIELIPIVGKFDIGRIDIDQASTASKVVGADIWSDDDGPSAGTPVSKAVGEDTLSTTATIPDLSDGNPDAGDTKTDEVSFSYAEIAGIVTAGTDSPALVSFAPTFAANTAVTDSAGAVVKSKGETVFWANTAGVIQGVTATSRVVFTLTDDSANSQYDFDLLDQIDHANASGDNANLTLNLTPAFKVTDRDLDPASLSGNLVTVAVENDVPTRTTAVATKEVHEDALTGGNEDTTDGEADIITVTYSGADLAALANVGADENLDFDLRSAVIGTNVLLAGTTTVLKSQGDNVQWAAGANAATLLGKATDGRTVFSLVDNGNGTFTFTLVDQVDHSGAENDEELLTIDLTPAFAAKDFDGDALDLSAGGAITMKIENDLPFIAAQIASATIDRTAGASVTKSLNGDLGADEPAHYVIDFFEDLPGYDERVINDQTVEYWLDVDGDTVFETKAFTLALSDTANAGAGSYTFTNHIAAPQQVTDFDFDYLPSGQNLFGVLVDEANGEQLIDGLGLLVLGKLPDINNPGDGSMTNTSNTINTSQAGGVTIGVSNQLFDKPGEGAIFVYLNNPDDKSIAENPDSITPFGGLTQTSADDADTLGFVGTEAVTTASLEVTQRQGNAALGMKITAYDVNVPGPDDTIVSAADPEGKDAQVNDDVSPEARQFFDSPLAGAATVSLTALRVYNTTTDALIEAFSINQATGQVTTVDGDGDGIIETSPITVTTTNIGTQQAPIWTATVTSFGAGNTIEWDTAVPHDAVVTENTSGKWDLGGFSIAQGQDTPDLDIDFSIAMEDFDKDSGVGSSASFDDFTIRLDGTGQFDDPNNAPPSTPVLAAALPVGDELFQAAQFDPIELMIA